MLLILIKTVHRVRTCPKSYHYHCRDGLANTLRARSDDVADDKQRL